MSNILAVSPWRVVNGCSGELIGRTGRPPLVSGRSVQTFAVYRRGLCDQRIRVAIGGRLSRPRIRMGSQP